MLARFDWTKPPAWLGAAVVFVAGVVIILAYQPGAQAVSGDRGYLIYMAQAVARGEPIYQTTTAGYTPFAPMISALTMHLTGWLGVPSYLAPRLLMVPLVALTGVMLYIVVYRLTGSLWGSLWAGLFNFVSTGVMATSSANLQPKLLVQVFLLVSMVALLHRRWLWVGAAISAAAMCWQPSAALGAAPLLIALVTWGEHRGAALVRFVAGLVLGALPSILYLTLSGQWVDFWMQTVVVKLAVSETLSAGAGLDWFRQIVLGSIDEAAWVLLPLGALGLAAYSGRRLLLPPPGQSRLHIFMPESGGILLMTGVWVLYSTIADVTALEKQGGGDLVYAHHFLAFWAGWGLMIVHAVALWLLRGRLPWFGAASGLLLTAGIVGWTLTTAADNKIDYTLQFQEEELLELLPDGFDPAETVVVNLADIYVLTNTPSPLPVIEFSEGFQAYLDLRLPNGCQSLQEIVAAYPRVIIRGSARLPCIDQINEFLEDNRAQFESVLFVDNRFQIRD
jgi:hypothetical protein